MMHKRRIWSVSRYEDPEEMARALTGHNWTLCSAFETAAGTLWANDSTWEDALQEYGVLRRLRNADGAQEWRQVETVTVSWCSVETLRGYLAEADAGAFDTNDYGTVPDRQIEREHAPCPHCG